MKFSKTIVGPARKTNRLGNLLWKCAICTLLLWCILYTVTVNYVHPSGWVCLVAPQLHSCVDVLAINVFCKISYIKPHKTFFFHLYHLYECNLFDCLCLADLEVKKHNWNFLYLSLSFSFYKWCKSGIIKAIWTQYREISPRSRNESGNKSPPSSVQLAAMYFHFQIGTSGWIPCIKSISLYYRPSIYCLIVQSVSLNHCSNKKVLRLGLNFMDKSNTGLTLVPVY